MPSGDLVIAFVLLAIELVLLLISFYLILMWAMIFKELPLFHYNLNTTMKLVGITWITAVVARLLCIMVYIYDPPTLIDSTHFYSDRFPMHFMESIYAFAWTLTAAAIFLAVLERIAASVWLECYERREDKNLIHGALMFVFVVSSIFYCANYVYGLHLLATRTPYILLLLLAFISLLVFLHFHLLNKRRLRNALANRSFYSLNARFQLAENVRVGDIAIRQAYMVSGMVMVFVSTAMLLSCLHLNIPLYLLRSLSYIFLSVYNIAEAFNIAYGHPHFKKLYFAQLRRSLACCCAVNKNRVEKFEDGVKRHNIRNTDGLILNFSAGEEHRIVFMMLEKSWQ